MIIFVKKLSQVCDFCNKTALNTEPGTQKEFKLRMKAEGWRRIKRQDACKECVAEIQRKELEERAARPGKSSLTSYKHLKFPDGYGRVVQGHAQAGDLVYCDKQFLPIEEEASDIGRPIYKFLCVIRKGTNEDLSVLKNANQLLADMRSYDRTTAWGKQRGT